MTFYPVSGLCCTWSHVVVLPLAFALSPVRGLHPSALPYALFHALHQCSLTSGFVPPPLNAIHALSYALAPSVSCPLPIHVTLPSPVPCP